MMINPVTVTIDEHVIFTAIRTMRQRLVALRGRTSRQANDERDALERYIDKMEGAFDKALKQRSMKNA